MLLADDAATRSNPYPLSGARARRIGCIKLHQQILAYPRQSIDDSLCPIEVLISAIGWLMYGLASLSFLRCMRCLCAANSTARITKRTQSRLVTSRIVTACGSQYKGMPDHILKSQIPPRIKDHAHGVKCSACREKPNAQTRQSCHDRPVNKRATPTKKQVENDGQTIKTTRQQQLKNDADNRRQPDADEKAHRNKVTFHLGYEWRVGSGDHQENRGVIKAP
jgi:hypothetical protein